MWRTIRVLQWVYQYHWLMTLLLEFCQMFIISEISTGQLNLVSTGPSCYQAATRTLVDLGFTYAAIIRTFPLILTSHWLTAGSSCLLLVETFGSQCLLQKFQYLSNDQTINTESWACGSFQESTLHCHFWSLPWRVA